MPPDMKVIIARILISAVSVLIVESLLSGVHVQDSWTALWVALLLAFLNATVRPLLILLTLPVTIFTLGFFLFVINACIIMLADYWVKGFDVDGFGWALLFCFLLAIINSIIQGLLLKGHDKNKK